MMSANAQTPWSGDERRTSHRLRKLIDHIYDRILELRADISLHSSGIAQLRSDLEDLRTEVMTRHPVGMDKGATPNG